jgi:hypothetical protein
LKDERARVPAADRAHVRRGQSDDLIIVHRAVIEEITGKVQTMARGERVFPLRARR